ncbi:erythromycin esterase family protein [Pseudonocardia sp. MCCB 268]|nr:erythromycin esterase family protein [Pseudonocardia cytotoxica]
MSSAAVAERLPAGREGDWPDSRCATSLRRRRPEGSRGRGPRARLRPLADSGWANTAVSAAARVAAYAQRGLPAAERVGFPRLDAQPVPVDDGGAGLAVRTRAGAGRRRRAAYACFELFGTDLFEYQRGRPGKSVNYEAPVVDVLTALRERAPRADGGEDPFAAEQNAAVVAGAERYTDSWCAAGPRRERAGRAHGRHLDRLLGSMPARVRRAWCGRTTPISAMPRPLTWSRTA